MRQGAGSRAAMAALSSKPLNKWLLLGTGCPTTGTLRPSPCDSASGYLISAAPVARSRSRPTWTRCCAACC